MSKVPYLHWAKKGAARHTLNKLLLDAEELEHILTQYPSVRYEPLDAHYRLLNVLSALDERLVSDICSHYEQHYGWRASVILCVLILLSPCKSYLKHLELLQDVINENNRWLLDLAIKELRNESASHALELQEAFSKARPYFSTLKLRKIELPPCPNEEYWECFRLEKQELSSVYKLEGLQGARRVIDNARTLKNELRYL